jgi:hypothetical protein
VEKPVASALTAGVGIDPKPSRLTIGGAMPSRRPRTTPSPSICALTPVRNGKLFFHDSLGAAAGVGLDRRDGRRVALVDCRCGNRFRFTRTVRLDSGADRLAVTRQTVIC